MLLCLSIYLTEKQLALFVSISFEIRFRAAAHY